MPDLLFLKLGGSLITDKTGVEAPRMDVIERLASEIAAVRDHLPESRLLLGHGSGSFGHVAAAKYGTRDGVFSPEGWEGFAEVAATAARLNRLVVSAMIAAGVPALSVAPSATAQCQEGRLAQMETTALNQALDAGLVPVVYGDVAFDTVRGGTIVSTEEVLSFLASHLQPTWLLLAGEVPGVLDADGQVVPLIRPENFEAIAPALGGSRGTDVTGGMAAKVGDMLALVQAHPGLRVRIFSGLEEELLGRLLSQPDSAAGTLIIAG